VPILSAEFDSSRLLVRIPSTGCTQSADFLPRTRRSDTTPGAVQLILTRVRPDACPGRSAGTKLLEYWLHEIGIRPGDRVRVVNPFEPGSASWPEPATGLRFLIEPRTVRPGDTVTLLLQNNYPQHVGYNLCGSGLERRQGGAWLAIPLGGVCTRELRSVGARQEARYEQRLPATLALGEYRFSTGVETPQHRGKPGLERIFSESFYVRR